MPKQVESGRDPFFKPKNNHDQERKNSFFKSKVESREQRGRGESEQDTSHSGIQKKFKFVKGAFGKSRSVNFASNNERKHEQEIFHKGKGGGVDENSKKPFDKKLYRMKKYSNKYKLDKWEDKRRKEVLKKYYKEIKNDPMAGKYRPVKFDEEPDGFDETDRIHYVLNPQKLEEMKQKFGKGKSDKLKRNPALKAREEMMRLKQEKIAAKEAKIKAAKEKEEAIAKYKAKKAERFKKLSKKTRTGQPLMKDRMQMLLESIQKTV